MSDESDQSDSVSSGGESSECHSSRDIVSRRESIDILSSSLDRIVRESDPSRPSLYHRDIDSSKIYSIACARKDSESSAINSFSSVRKDSDASALSVLVKDEEEMMRQDEELALSGTRSRSNSYIRPLRKNSDPFENLRKLSDASDTVYALRKLSEGSDPLKSLRKDSDVILGEETLVQFKSSDNGVNLLGEIMKLDAPAKDDSSVNLFQNPDNLEVEPTPVIQKGSHVTSKALEHLDALGSEKRSDDGSASIATLNDANQKILMDALLGNPRRNRAESWGGMSDISAHQAALLGNFHSSGADVSNSQTPRGPSPHGFEGVILSPRSQSQDSLAGHFHRYDDRAKRRDSSDGIPDKIGIPLNTKERDRVDSFSGFAVPLPKNSNRDRAYSFTRDRLDSWTIRDRLDSIANRDRLDSLANLSGIFSRNRDRIDSLASLGEVSLTMSLGDLEDVAGKLELVIQGDDSDIGDTSSEVTVPKPAKLPKQLGVLPAPTIHVDSEAVESAVQAAMAATSGDILDILQINTPGKSTVTTGDNQYAATPLTSNITSKSLTENKKIEDIRAKARAAAGYVRPDSSGPNPLLSAKKRSLSNSSNTFSKKPRLPTHYSTPTSRPKSVETVKVPSGVHLYSDSPDLAANDNNDSSSNCAPSSSSKGGQSNQKWEEMFECLVNYVQEQRQNDTEGMSEEDAEKWEWSGNVPTMYKTSDGKALGRWINNQRSAKSKGSLKPEREERLISTGLKWSVLTTNAWTDMLEELKVYVKEKTKNGQTWDGNVPTNYKIKSNGKNETEEGDDDKNLGRWINRQRSLYQAGKLKDDRRKQLEQVGLKWAVLSTTSWQTMYDALCEYANSKRSSDKHGHWDGNVPASYETDEKPPKKLGRWVNRQRSAYANKKLKKEFVEKLEKAGLKWTANDCKKDMEPDDIARQRMLAQSQKGIIRSAPQGIKSGTIVVHSGGGPIVAGKAPTTGQTIITNSTGLSVNIPNVHPALVKVGIPGSQKNVSSGTSTTVTTSRPMQTKVIIPSRSVSNPSASKVIIPARSLAENGASKSKVVIPARSASSVRNTKVVIPARSLAQIGSTASKVTLPARASITIATKTKKVAVPSASVPRNQENVPEIAKIGQSTSNLPALTSTLSVKAVNPTADKLMMKNTSTPIISNLSLSSTVRKGNPVKLTKPGSHSKDGSTSQSLGMMSTSCSVQSPNPTKNSGTSCSNTPKNTIVPALPLTVNQPSKPVVILKKKPSNSGTTISSIMPTIVANNPSSDKTSQNFKNDVLAPSTASSQAVSSQSSIIVKNSISFTSLDNKSPALASSSGVSRLSSKVVINNPTSTMCSNQGNITNGGVASHHKISPAQLKSTNVNSLTELRTVSQTSKALDHHAISSIPTVTGSGVTVSDAFRASRIADANLNSSSNPQLENDE